VGLSPILFLTAYLSLDLAVVNLLPIPGLDGGRLLFILIEVLRRGKRVSPEREGLVHLIGLATLLLLVLLITINDIGNFGH
jgi:regulator of sigma E protease